MVNPWVGEGLALSDPSLFYPAFCNLSFLAALNPRLDPRPDRSPQTCQVFYARIVRLRLRGEGLGGNGLDMQGAKSVCAELGLWASACLHSVLIPFLALTMLNPRPDRSWV